MTEQRGHAGSRGLYGGIWSTLSGLFRVPRDAPALPSLGFGKVEAFRPAPGFLRYLKLKFWIVLLLIDAVLVAAWVAASIFEPWFGALLAIPVLGLVVIPDLLAYTAIHLRYDTTWYVLSDRSMRLRRGIMTIVETTITFENVQNVKIQQGPLQRWCGIANLIVETAGGGDESEEEGLGAHVGLIEGVADAQRIRDLILPRLHAGGETEPGNAARPRIAPWPSAHLAVLREIRRALGGQPQDEPQPSPMPADQQAPPAGSVPSAIGWLLRMAVEPPSLPPWAGRSYRFRPARPYLWYQLTLASLTGGSLAAIPLTIGVLLVVKHPELIATLNLALLFSLWVMLLVVILTLSAFMAWLQYRVTWYVLGQRGVRIRRGVWVIRETTTSFDNVQNVNLSQGPLARLFGLSTIEIHTAGGDSSTAAGGGGPKQVLTVLLTIVSSMIPALSGLSYGGGGPGKQGGRPSAAGRLVGIIEAPAVRDRIMARVRESRTAALGDETDRPRRIRWTSEQLGVLREIRRLVVTDAAPGPHEDHHG